MQPVSLASVLTNIGTSDRYVINANRELELIPASQLAYEHDAFTGDVLGLLTEPESTNYFPDSENMTTDVFRTGGVSLANTSVMGRPKSVGFGAVRRLKSVGANFDSIPMERCAVTFFVRNGDWSTPIIGQSYDPNASLHLKVNGREIIESVTEVVVDGPFNDSSYRVRANFPVLGGVLNKFEIASSATNAVKIMYVSGVQVEKDVWTSYMPTNGTPVTRGLTAYDFHLIEGEYFNTDQGTIDLVYTPFYNATGAALTIGEKSTWESDHLSMGIQGGVITDYPCGAALKSSGGLGYLYQYSQEAAERNARIRLCYSGYGVRYVVNEDRIIRLKDFRSFKEVLPSGKMTLGQAPDGSVMSGYITMFNAYARTFMDKEMTQVITEIVENDDLISRTAGAVFRTDVEALMYQNVVEPPTPQRVLAAWPRATNHTYFSDPQRGSGGNINAWYFDDVQYSFVQPVNSTTYEQIFSPIKLDSYVFESTLSSTQPDGDLIGLVAAADVIDGELVSLVFICQTGGRKHMPSFCAALLDNQTTQNSHNIYPEIITGNDFLPQDPNATTQSNTNPDWGWWNRQVKMQIIRNGKIVTATISTWNGDTLEPASTLTVNLEALPRNGKELAKGGRYGFFSHSQAGSTYLDYNLQSNKVINETKIYSSATGKYWRFVQGDWVLQDETASDDLLPASTAINPKTKESYEVDEFNVSLQGSSGVSEGEATLFLPANSVNDIEYSEIIDQFEFVDDLHYGGTYEDTNLISEQVDGKLRIVTENTDGYFYFLMRTDLSYDNFGIGDETIAFRKVNVQVI